MSINIADGFGLKSTTHDFKRQNFAKVSDLSKAKDTDYPHTYIAYVEETPNILYIYSKNNTVDSTYGKFRPFSPSGGEVKLVYLKGVYDVDNPMPTTFNKGEIAYNSDSMLIFTATDNDVWGVGVPPEENTLYFDTNESKLYTYHDSSMSAYGGGSGSSSGGDAKLANTIQSNIAVGAAPSNTIFPKDMSFTAFARKLLIKEIIPTIQFTATNSGIQKVGTTVTSSLLNVKITNLPAISGTINMISFYEDDVLITDIPFTAGVDTYSYNYACSITEDVTLHAEVRYQKSDASIGVVKSDVKIEFYNPSYFGFLTTTTPVETDIKALTENLKDVKEFDWLNISCDDKHLCYAYPDSLGDVTSIKDQNNFEYINSYTQSTIEVNGEDYLVYITNDPITVTNYSQKYS